MTLRNGHLERIILHCSTFVLYAWNSIFQPALTLESGPNVDILDMVRKESVTHNAVKRKPRIVEPDFEHRLLALVQENEYLKKCVQDKKKQLKEIRAQLTQTAKLANLGIQGASIAHELNNPLTAISAEADEIFDAIQGGYDDRQFIKASIENIKKYAGRMRVIIDHLRPFTADAACAEWTKVNVNDIINDALILLERQLRNSAIKINLFLSENLPIIWGQYYRLESVFQNLITNACQAFNKVDDGRDKQISIFSFLEEDRKIVVKVKDNASGIPRKIRGKIFKPFFTTKDRVNGTGLGLFIAHDIVKEHHGEIKVDSEVGRGTEFTVKLPLERRASANVQPKSPPQGAKKILLIDDDEAIVDILKRRLERMGFGVTTACDGTKAIKVIHKKRLDLVICDLTLPDGVETAEVLSLAREQDPKVKFVAMSGHLLSHEAIDRMLKSGVNLFVKKPFPSLGEVAQQVADLVV